MSKIFKVTGNFSYFMTIDKERHRNEWQKPDPSFAGYILVEDDGSFYGYSEEYYKLDEPDNNDIRYIVGSFGKNRRNFNQGIAFFKISNNPRQSPVMFVISDLESECAGFWAAFVGPVLAAQGNARLSVTEIEYNRDLEIAIRKQYNKVDKSNPYNSYLLDATHICVDAIR